MAALCVTLAEELVPGDDVVTTRLSLDLVRPVLTRPTKGPHARLLKSGRRVQLVQIESEQDDRPVVLAACSERPSRPCRCRTLRTRASIKAARPIAPTTIRRSTVVWPRSRPVPFMRLATEFRTRSPQGLYERGKKFAWLRVYANLLPGVPLSNGAAACCRRLHERLGRSLNAALSFRYVVFRTSTTWRASASE